MTKTIKKQLLDAKINGASKLEIQRLQQLLDKEIEKQFDELRVKILIVNIKLQKLSVSYKNY